MSRARKRDVRGRAAVLDDGAPGAPPTAGFWTAVASFAVLLAATPFVPARPAPLMRGVAVVLLALAAVFAGLPFLQRPRSAAVPAGAPVAGTTGVARGGLYAVVRHPQYLGYDLLAWGLALLALYWGTILPAIGVTAGLFRQARDEEAWLVEHFGEEYRAYRRTVPRFGVLTGIARLLRRRAGAPS